jgi:hypothetical protein
VFIYQALLCFIHWHRSVFIYHALASFCVYLSSIGVLHISIVLMNEAHQWLINKHRTIPMFEAHQCLINKNRTMSMYEAHQCLINKHHTLTSFCVYLSRIGIVLCLFIKHWCASSWYRSVFIYQASMCINDWSINTERYQ